MNTVNKNRANDIPIDDGMYKGLQLVDIDTTIFNYIQLSIIPLLYQNGEAINVPLIYGNAERWNDVKINGYIRDARGMVQIPLIMMNRSSVEHNENIPYFKDITTMPSISMYSKKNRYERFSVINDIKPVYEIYNISVPDYVTITYNISMWTNFTEHMNKLLEQFQYASNRYWGDKKGYKFFTKVDSLDTTQEVNDGEVRMIKTEFTITVNGYILPTEYKNKLTINKELSSKKIITTVESKSALSENALNITKYTTKKQKNVIAEWLNNTTLAVNDINSLVPNNKFKIYINNIPIPISDTIYVYNESENKLIFTLQNHTINETDTIFVNGIFI